MRDYSETIIFKIECLDKSYIDGTVNKHIMKKLYYLKKTNEMIRDLVMYGEENGVKPNIIILGRKSFDSRKDMTMYIDKLRKKTGCYIPHTSIIDESEKHAELLDSI